MSIRTRQHFADVDDSKIKSERQMQLKIQYLQGFKDGVMSQRELCTDVISREAVIKWLIDKDIIKTKSQEENARKELEQLTYKGESERA